VSDACLVLDPPHAEAGAEQFLDEVIFLIVEGSAPERADRQRVIDRRAVGQIAYKSLVPLNPG
jgi:hypothetical protein